MLKLGFQGVLRGGQQLFFSNMAGKCQVIVMAGPSGSGKSTLLKKLFAEYQDKFAFSVSHTTRQPRPKEIDGIDYHFTTKDDMKAQIEKDEFVEHAEFSGNMYGTSKQSIRNVQATGKICVLDIDIQGVKSVKKTDLNPLYVFIKPPSMESLEERLRSRGTETEESLAKRLATAKSELEYAQENGAFDHVIVNDNLDTAYEEFKTVLKPTIASCL